MIQTISHEAVVKTVDSEFVRVTILQSSACSGCAAKQMCNSAEAKEKEVDVYTDRAADYRVGQKVLLEGRLSDGRKAAMIAYGLPLLLLIPTLFISTWLTNDEMLGALWSLLTVVIYYIVISLFFRKRLQHQFSFHLLNPLPED